MNDYWSRTQQGQPHLPGMCLGSSFCSKGHSWPPDDRHHPPTPSTSGEVFYLLDTNVPALPCCSRQHSLHWK